MFEHIVRRTKTSSVSRSTELSENTSGAETNVVHNPRSYGDHMTAACIGVILRKTLFQLGAAKDSL